jgi:hypothetical protein
LTGIWDLFGSIGRNHHFGLCPKSVGHGFLTPGNKAKYLNKRKISIILCFYEEFKRTNFGFNFYSFLGVLDFAF